MPSGAVDSAWRRTAPLITAKELRALFFLGLPLVSYVQDPVTGLATVITDGQLDAIIEQQLNVAEEDLNIRLFPTQIIERQPWDRNLYLQYGYLKLRERPISSIEEVLICSSDINAQQLAGGETPNNEGVLFRVPLEWVEVGNVRWGQINIVPLTTVALSGLNQGGVLAGAGQNGSAAFLNLMSQARWVGSYWLLRYTVGFPNSNFPVILNRYVGILAAIDILSQLAATNASNSSTSLGIDALSEGRSTPGPQLYVQRINDLQTERGMLKAKIENYFSRKIFVSSI